MLFVVALLNYVDRSILSILQEPIKRELDLSDTQLGALTGLSFALLYATLALPIARLADRWVRTRLLAICLTTWSAMTALTGAAGGFWMLAACRMGVAVGEAGSGPTSHSLIADHFPRERRGTALAVMALAIPAGIMLGTVGGGWLSEALGWRQAFALVGALGLVVAPLVWLMPEPQRGRLDAAVAASAGGWRDALRMVWARRSFRLLLAGATLQAYVLHAFQSWVAPFYMRAHQWPLEQVALAVGLMFGIGGGLGAFLGGALVDRLSPRDAAWFGRVPAVAAAAAVPLLLLQFFVPDARLSIALGFGAAFALNAFIAPVNAAVQSSVPANTRAFASAMLLAVPTILGLGLGPLVTGILSDALATRVADGQSLRYATAASFGMAALAAVAFARAGRHLRHDLR